MLNSTRLIDNGEVLIARTAFITRAFFIPSRRRSELRHTGGFLSKPTLQIQHDGYGLIRAAHRLSSEAAVAVKAANRDAVHGLWKIDCSSAIAQELWTWFDDCEQHSELLPREAWKVGVCQRAKERIARAIGNT